MQLHSKCLTPIATALLLAAVPPAALAEKHADEMEQHGSHEHGAARLTIATTDDGLEIALESPAANLFGFEHKAKTETEHDAVHDALEKLKDGAALFTVNAAAECALETVDIESSAADSHDAEKHGEHEHEKEEKHAKHEDDDHKDEHEHEKEEKHAKHEDDDHADEESSHSDVDVVWALHCEQPTAIESVNVKLFSAFPDGFAEIAVEWITAANAGKTELEKDGVVSLSQ